MTLRWYGSGIQKVINGTVSLTTSNIDWLLLTSGYTFNADHDFVTDLTPGTNELAGGSYARIDIVSPTVTEDDTNDGAYWDATDPSFPSLGAAAGTPAWLVGFVNVGTDATNILLCSLALPGTAPNGNNYQCQLKAPPEGIGYWRNVAGAGLWYNTGIKDVMTGVVDLLTDVLNATLHTTTYVANPDQDTYANLTNELSGGNYAEVVVGGKSVTVDDANDGAYIDATDPSYTSLQAVAGSPTQMVVHSQTAADRLLFHTPLTTPATPNGNNYVINLAAPTNGLAWVHGSAS